MKIFLYFVGKPRDPHANAMADGFAARIAHYTRIEMREMRPSADPWQKHGTARKVALDPAGKPLDSGGFTSLISKAEMEARDLVFTIGGADGLPSDWRAGADLRLSLSPMTYPHELARVMLAEQIYRTFATLRGHPYPR